jgi:hypothetical protein
LANWQLGKLADWQIGKLLSAVRRMANWCTADGEWKIDNLKYWYIILFFKQDEISVYRFNQCPPFDGSGSVFRFAFTWPLMGYDSP